MATGIDEVGRRGRRPKFSKNVGIPISLQHSSS